MSSLSGVRFDITGASGSQGLLSPKSSWRAYVLPRGGNAKQDSTGTLITFDSASVASRFAVNDWVQSGSLVANIRKVSAVGGNSINVAGAALTVSENDRVFVIGTTQPTVTGGSATYTTPNTIIRERDDSAADTITNSMITSDSNGLIQFWAEPNTFDLIIQDGNQSNQGSIVDVLVGISTSEAVVFGATATFNGAVGVTGWAFFGVSVTVTGALGVTGTVAVGSTLTAHAGFGVTASSIFGETCTIVGTSGNYEHTGTALFGNTVTVSGALGVTGHVVLGGTATVTGSLINATVTTLANSGTPSVAGANLFKTGGTSGISFFSSGTLGQRITLLAKHAMAVWYDGSSQVLNGGLSQSMTDGDTLTLQMLESQKWYEISRSNND